MDLHERPYRDVYSSLKAWLEENESFPLLPKCSQINKRVTFESQAIGGGHTSRRKEESKADCPEVLPSAILGNHSSWVTWKGHGRPISEVSDVALQNN